MYVPHTEAERQEMLRKIGVESLEDLFIDVPSAHRFPDLVLPRGTNRNGSHGRTRWYCLRQ